MLRYTWNDSLSVLTPESHLKTNTHHKTTQIARFVGPTWGPPGSCRPQMGPMLAPWTLLLGELQWPKIMETAKTLALTLEISPPRVFMTPYYQWLHLVEFKSSGYLYCVIRRHNRTNRFIPIQHVFVNLLYICGYKWKDIFALLHKFCFHCIHNKTSENVHTTT